MTLTDDLQNKYAYKAEAEALFFKNVHDKPAFRFEVPSLGWEFTDGFYIGADPEGIFYYGSDFVDLPKDNSTKAIYLVKQHREGDTLYVHITFTKKDDNKVLGEFLAKDPHNVAGSSDLLDVTKEGSWQKTSYVYATASAAKVSGGTKITITCRSLHKEATFDCDNAMKDENIGVDGQLTITDIETVNDAKCVKWYQDHAVFYNNTDSKEFSAFFFPEEGHDKPLGSKATGEETGGVEWKHI